MSTITGADRNANGRPMLEFDVQGGGVVATALATSARLGLKARYIGKFGTDFWSRASVRSLAHEGVDVRHVIRVKGPGHVSLVIADRVTGADGAYWFAPQSGDCSAAANPFAATCIVTASAEGYIFTPPQRAVVITDTNRTGQDFSAIPVYTVSGTAAPLIITEHPSRNPTPVTPRRKGFPLFFTAVMP